MDGLIEILINFIRTYDLNSPFSFVIVILVALAFLRRWNIFLLVLLTAVLGWGARDMAIMNIQTQKQLINLPLIVYSVGGIAFVIIILITFYKS